MEKRQVKVIKSKKEYADSHALSLLYLLIEMNLDKAKEFIRRIEVNRRSAES